ncbi:MAG: transposase [Candidatus Methylomirabilales bacterium]
MARRPRIFAPGLLYHVIVRGNHRQRTFRKANDYEAYLDRLATYRRKHGIRIYAYCLMPNHVHLLLESTQAPLARFMQGLQQSYTQFFNRMHHKVGHLFQGRYQAIVCEKEPYLLALIRYIHLNPVRAQLVAQPEQYPYSGHVAYLRGQATAVLDPAPVLGLLGGRHGYQRFVREGMARGHTAEYYEVADQRFLGQEGFGERLQAKVGEQRKPPAKMSVETAGKAIAAHLKMNPTLLQSPDRGWEVSRLRTLVAYTLVRRIGFPLRVVAGYLGRDAATVSSLISRLADRIQADPQLRREVERLVRIV